MRLWERWQFCMEHGWTFEQYDGASAADLLLAKEFAAIMSGLKRETNRD